MVDEHLRTVPAEVTKVTDLCGAVRLKKNEIKEILVGENERQLVIGCHGRAMHFIVNQLNDEAEQIEFEDINLIGAAGKEICERIDAFCSTEQGKNVFKEITEDSGWPSWYPVIDYSRCTACGQCADFCLFGVYEKTANGVNVVNPQGCKNNCPACARICPSSAIIFPKYKNGGAVGGSDVIDEVNEQRRQAEDIKKYLGDNIYEALNTRKEKRQSIIREDAMKKAMTERDKALKGEKN